MENNEKSSFNFKSLFAAIVIPSALIICYLLFEYVMGSPENFEKKDITKHGVNFLGIMYKGGYIVPVLMSFFLMVFIFSFERLITISFASGKGSVDGFVRRVKTLLANNQINAALQECDRQKGSVGNVAHEVLVKYEQMAATKGLTKEQKIAAIQKTQEEATALELPMLEKNLTIIATLASISTLVGLLGTVVGMIKAFGAMAQEGAQSQTALANGISEALINTALGISASALAIIAYNFFTSKIDSLTYNIDEIGYSITQNFSSNVKEESRPSESVLA